MPRMQSASMTVVAPSGRAKFLSEICDPTRCCTLFIDSEMVNSCTRAGARCEQRISGVQRHGVRGCIPTPVPAMERLVRTYASHVRSFAR
jgi:hypothetical protein